MSNHVLKQITNLLLSQKRSFAIDLGEFGLSVCPQILVTKTLRDLVVTVKSRHHQQLFKELRGLWERKKLPCVDPRGHEIVPSSLRRALGKHRCFDVQKSLSVQVAPHFHRHPVAQDQVALHRRSAKVQNPMGQPGGLRKIVVIQLKRRRH